MKYTPPSQTLKCLQITSDGEGVEKRKPSYTFEGSVNWCSHYAKQYGVSSKKLKIELPYGPAIPHGGQGGEKGGVDWEWAYIQQNYNSKIHMLK